jgi:hypothetical protein
MRNGAVQTACVIQRDAPVADFFAYPLGTNAPPGTYLTSNQFVVSFKEHVITKMNWSEKDDSN